MSDAVVNQLIQRFANKYPFTKEKTESFTEQTTESIQKEPIPPQDQNIPQQEQSIPQQEHVPPQHLDQEHVTIPDNPHSIPLKPIEKSTFGSPPPFYSNIKEQSNHFYHNNSYMIWTILFIFILICILFFLFRK